MLTKVCSLGGMGGDLDTEAETEPLSTHVSAGTPGGGTLGPGERTLSAVCTFLSILGGSRFSSVLWHQPLTTTQPLTEVMLIFS